ncbi:hypothetical protein HG530_004665 [Fusarium avenaceum]|nr:hypothetical protein HG530_004665 [Fusarium avenaceum]
MAVILLIGHRSRHFSLVWVGSDHEDLLQVFLLSSEAVHISGEFVACIEFIVQITNTPILKISVELTVQNISQLIDFAKNPVFGGIKIFFAASTLLAIVGMALDERFDGSRIQAKGVNHGVDISVNCFNLAWDAFLGRRSDVRMGNKLIHGQASFYL